MRCCATAGNGPTDPLDQDGYYRGEDAKDKANTMRAYWVPGVNNLEKFGRWAFAEFTAVYEMEAEFANLVEASISGGQNV